MEIRELAIAGAWEITTKHFPDERGIFLEAYKSSVFKETIGHRLDVRQVNTSVSKAGTVRGIHFADVPPSQAKYVMCPRGAVLDFVIDIRVGSPTFGKWDSVLLDDDTRKAIYISEGLGHCFVALEDDSTVVYLCSAQYAPGREHGVNPLCSQVGLVFPETDRQGKKLELLLSPKDTDAPDLDEAERSGLLPRYEDVQAFLATLRS
ncbi:dTDP-4-dehydrorhamnose 3,5-epimerase family protein [Actinotignum sp. GS-2025e]|uniref:dTDP-4-dehydrorhamnose 3,5-epimerase family protein n=1 Tax=Actinotignum sp. GS-2025e TaxID=3427278 RepID=UPI003F45A991